MRENLFLLYEEEKSHMWPKLVLGKNPNSIMASHYSSQDHLPVISMEAKLEKALQAEVRVFFYMLTACSYLRI